jgi:hypothetical protein
MLSRTASTTKTMALSAAHGARLRLAAWWPAVAVACGLALLAAYSFRSIVAAADHRLPGLDAPIHYAWEVYTRAALDAGVWPLWNPYAWSGTPHFADALTMTAYPPAFLLRWLPAVEFFRWMIVVHLVIGGTGALYLARLIGLHWLSATAAAVAVALGGAAASWVHLGRDRAAASGAAAGPRHGAPRGAHSVCRVRDRCRVAVLPVLRGMARSRIVRRRALAPAGAMCRARPRGARAQRVPAVAAGEVRRRVGTCAGTAV